MVDQGLGIERGGPWVAWLSTSTTNAVDRLASYSGPFAHAVTGLTIAENLEDLTDGKLCNGIQRDEFGASWVHFAWTGSLSDGTLGAGTCGDWTSGSRNASATYGFNPASDQTSTDNGLTATFQNHSIGNPPISYEWDFGDGSPTESLENPVHVFPYRDDFEVSLTVTNAQGRDAIV